MKKSGVKVIWQKKRGRNIAITRTQIYILLYTKK